MKTRKRFFFLIAVFLLFSAVNAMALPTSWDRVRMDVDWSLPAPYAPYTMHVSNGEVYKTFCLESENYFSEGTTYYVTSVGEYATGGGGGATSAGDPVSDETKWLYAAYMSGIFDGVDNAGYKVQRTIWWLEDEADGIDSYWAELNGFQFDDSAWTVVAVNLTNFLHTRDIQSQLIGTAAPVPEPATLLLLGTGLIGLARINRKKFGRS